MAKLPTVVDLGGLDRLSGSRPVGSYDGGGAIARAGAAIGEGAQQLGKGVAKLGEGVIDYELDKGRFEYAKAHADQVTNQIQLYQEAQNDLDYATMGDRYGQRIGKVNEDAAALISSPFMRDRFLTDSKSGVAQFKSNIDSHAKKLEGDANIAYVHKQGDTFINQAIATTDEVTRSQVIDAHNQLVDGLAARRFVSADQALGMKKQWAQRYAHADVLRLIDDDPAEAVRRIQSGDADKSIYSIMAPDARVDLLHRARVALRAKTGQELVNFDARVKDVEVEARLTGNVTRPVSEGDFTGRLGEAAGRQAFERHQAEVELWKQVHRLAPMDADEQRQILESYRPEPGGAAVVGGKGAARKLTGGGFAEQARRYGEIEKAIKNLEAAKNGEHSDAASFAISYLPLSRAAFQKYGEVLNSPAASLEDKQAAATDYATKTIMEQSRAGVRPDNLKILPKSYIDSFKTRLANPGAAGGAGNVAASIENEAKIWGDNWPRVNEQLGKAGVEPVVRVIGAGVKPLAGQLLAEFAHVKLGDIANDQSEEKLATIKKDVRDTFRPFAASMTGSEGTQRAIDDFQVGGEKLAAYYVRTGKTSTDAAKQAFDDLVGHKYEFVGDGKHYTAGDRYRVPKYFDNGQPASFTRADVELGANTARAQIEKYGIEPKRGPPGAGADFAQRETEARYRRDAIWVTAPKEQGLMLVYGDQAVRRKDGAPLILSWGELADIATRVSREAGQSIGVYPAPGEMP